MLLSSRCKPPCSLLPYTSICANPSQLIQHFSRSQANFGRRFHLVRRVNKPSGTEARPRWDLASCGSRYAQCGVTDASERDRVALSARDVFFHQLKLTFSPPLLRSMGLLAWVRQVFLYKNQLEAFGCHYSVANESIGRRFGADLGEVLSLAGTPTNGCPRSNSHNTNLQDQSLTSQRENKR